MHYVIIRDDDTNALTPVECLERLYRPFLERGLPVNLAVIPNVATDTRMPDGGLEGYLAAGSCPELRAVAPHPSLLPQEEGAPPRPAAKSGRSQIGSNLPSLPPLPEGEGWGEGETAGQPPVAIASPEQSSVFDERQAAPTLPIATNEPLVHYLRENPEYHIVQHGCRHEYWEFDRLPDPEIGARLDEGTELLMEAGFRRPETFVAPYDKLSRGSLLEVAQRFRVLSTGWYELCRLPLAWWPQYALKKIRGAPDWKIGRTLLLSHPGCLLSYTRAYKTMLETIVQHVHDQHLTVLVTHWWEYFRNGQPDDPLIEVLHATGDYLAAHPEIKVITFADLAHG